MKKKIYIETNIKKVKKVYKDNVYIRKFNESDISNKIKWINDSANNKFLHYDLPLEYERTKKWYTKIKDREDRFDGVIEYENIPVGIIGLLNIDIQNQKAEYYITLGENEFKGKGIAYKASIKILEYAFEQLNLNKIYLYTEVENIIAQKLFDKLGFEKEGKLKEDLIINNKKKDRYIYAIFRRDWIKHSK